MNRQSDRRNHMVWQWLKFGGTLSLCFGTPSPNNRKSHLRRQYKKALFYVLCFTSFAKTVENLCHFFICGLSFLVERPLADLLAFKQIWEYNFHLRPIYTHISGIQLERKKWLGVIVNSREIWSSHNGLYQDYCRVGYDAVSLADSTTTLALPSSFCHPTLPNPCVSRLHSQQQKQQHGT
jgi:hypothetical protein